LSELPGDTNWVGAKHSAPPGVFFTRYMIFIAFVCGSVAKRIGILGGHFKAGLGLPAAQRLDLKGAPGTVGG
jgi:hypothetical protein